MVLTSSPSIQCMRCNVERGADHPYVWMILNRHVDRFRHLKCALRGGSCWFLSGRVLQVPRRRWEKKRQKSLRRAVQTFSGNISFLQMFLHTIQTSNSPALAAKSLAHSLFECCTSRLCICPNLAQLALPSGLQCKFFWRALVIHGLLLQRKEGRSQATGGTVESPLWQHGQLALCFWAFLDSVGLSRFSRKLMCWKENGMKSWCWLLRGLVAMQGQWWAAATPYASAYLWWSLPRRAPRRKILWRSRHTVAQFFFHVLFTD